MDSIETLLVHHSALQNKYPIKRLVGPRLRKHMPNSKQLLLPTSNHGPRDVLIATSASPKISNDGRFYTVCSRLFVNLTICMHLCNEHKEVPLNAFASSGNTASPTALLTTRYFANIFY